MAFVSTVRTESASFSKVFGFNEFADVVGMYGRPMKDFARVQVANPRNNLLIEQQHFDFSSRTQTTFRPLLNRHSQRIRTELVRPQ